LLNSHLVNSIKLATLIASAVHYDLDINGQLNLNYTQISFHSNNSRLDDSINSITHAFIKYFLIPPKLISDIFLFCDIKSCSNLLVILLEHSTFSIEQRLQIFKSNVSIDYDLSPCAWSIYNRWIKARSEANPYKDVMEMIYEDTPYQIHSLSYCAWSPHLGVSFGHLFYLFEQLISFDISSKSEEISNYYAPNESICAYTSLKLTSLLPVKSKNFCLNYIDLTIPLSAASLQPLLISPDMLTRKKYLDNLRLEGFHTATSKKSLPHFQLSTVLSTVHSNYGLFASFLNSLDYLIQKSVSPEIHAFKSKYSKYLVIHSRDSAYSGNGQPIRDSHFDNFDLSIKYLLNLNIGVVRISRISVKSYLAYENLLDLSRVNNSTLSDQIYLLRNASYIVGTGSGISHWHCINSCPMLYVNSLVMHPDGFSDSVLISPKRSTRNHSEQLNPDRIKSFSTHWSHNLIEQIMPRQLTPDELLLDISYFIESYSEKKYINTLHQVLREMNIPICGAFDSYITPGFKEHLRNSASQDNNR